MFTPQRQRPNPLPSVHHSQLIVQIEKLPPIPTPQAHCLAGVEPRASPLVDQQFWRPGPCDYFQICHSSSNNAHIPVPAQKHFLCNASRSAPEVSILPLIPLPQAQSSCSVCPSAEPRRRCLVTKSSGAVCHQGEPHPELLVTRSSANHPRTAPKPLLVMAMAPDPSPAVQLLPPSLILQAHCCRCSQAPRRGSLLADQQHSLCLWTKASGPAERNLHQPWSTINAIPLCLVQWGPAASHSTQAANPPGTSTPFVNTH
jgi:hypothetical protein